MSKQLDEKLKDLPQKPGVYIFKDAKGLILYVGKAIKLKNRVSSYFKKDAGDDRGPRIQLMISQIRDLDYTVTDNETESLILENNFIKQFKPKYNVDLRDDKNYLFVKINIHDEIPTMGFDRRPSDKSARYFGPYTAANSVRDTLRLIRRIFPYCANKKITSKPCFYYHIGKCPGVCFGKISVEEYKTNYIKKIMQFLDGRQLEIVKDLKLQMKGYSNAKLYEKAARVRDQVFAINRIMERQKLVYTSNIDQDVISLYQDGVAVINLFIIRGGKLIQKENFILDNAKQVTPQEILETFMSRYYLDTSNRPKEILLPAMVNEEELLGVIKNNSPQPPLNLRGGGHRPGALLPRLLVPTRGKKLELLKLGTENAKQYLESTSDKNLLEEARLLASLKELQRVLDLPTLPGRIEAYDISNIQGTNPVGSMIVFDYARPKKSDYRKFKINKKQTPDDFAMMKEMLERRFARSLPLLRGRLRGGPDLETSPTPSLKGGVSWPLPDLILIDGGKGQLSSAVSVLKKYKITIPIMGLAKRLEEIFRPHNPRPLLLPPNSQALFLLQRIRDEAHRFAVKYHRHLRSKGSLTSVLDSLSGIGPAKKKLLLKKFGSAAKVRVASLTDLAAIVGSKLAEKIKASL